MRVNALHETYRRSQKEYQNEEAENALLKGAVKEKKLGFFGILVSPRTNIKRKE
jgi:hypothetical protein